MEVNGRTYCPLDVIRLEATIERLEAELTASERLVEVLAQHLDTGEG